MIAEISPPGPFAGPPDHVGLALPLEAGPGLLEQPASQGQGRPPAGLDHQALPGRLLFLAPPGPPLRALPPLHLLLGPALGLDPRLLPGELPPEDVLGRVRHDQELVAPGLQQPHRELQGRRVEVLGLVEQHRVEAGAGAPCSKGASDPAGGVMQAARPGTKLALARV